MKTIIGYIGTIMASLVFTVATLSVSASAQSGHPRSYYPTLTPDDISVCRAEFAAVQADVVQHLRLTAAHYRPGGVYSRGCPECNSEQIATYTNMANRVQTMDPVSFYVEGFRGDGEGVGDLAAWNGFDGEFSLQIHQRNLTEDVEPEGLDDLEYSIVRSQVQRAADRCVARIWMAKLNLMHQQVAAGRTEPGPLGLQDMPVGSSGSASAPTSSLAATATAAPSAENVFGECYRLEGPDRSGIQTIWQLRNICRTRSTLSYCLRADFEAAGDFNLCARGEYRTHSVAPGATVHFEFGLMPPGTALSDGRTVTDNSLTVRGYACANDRSPGVYFREGEFLSTGC